MIFNLNNEQEVHGFELYVERMQKERAVVEIKKKHRNRSLSQNNYLYLLLSYFASEYGISVDEAKIDFYKRICNRELFEREITNRKGYRVLSLRSSSELTTKEMSDSIERFRNFSSRIADIYLPAPNEHERIIYMQQEVERNKEFL